jgi:acyl carrier protein
MQANTIERVKSCISEVLAVKASEVGEDASLIGDLGADSLDLVELMFLLERQFGVRLAQDDLRLTKQLGLSEEEIHSNEVVTPVARERLLQLFPNAGQLLVEGVTRRQLAVLLTVRQVARAIEEKLSETTG